MSQHVPLYNLIVLYLILARVGSKALCKDKNYVQTNKHFFVVNRPRLMRRIINEQCAPTWHLNGF